MSKTLTYEHLAGSDSLRLPSNPKAARAALRLTAHWEELCVKDNAPTYLGWGKPLSDKNPLRPAPGGDGKE